MLFVPAYERSHAEHSPSIYSTMMYPQIIITGQHNKYADYISKLTIDKLTYPHLSAHRPKTKTHTVSKSDLLSSHVSSQYNQTPKDLNCQSKHKRQYVKKIHFIDALSSGIWKSSDVETWRAAWSFLPTCLKMSFKPMLPSPNRRQVQALHFRVICSGGWWGVVDRYTVVFIAENLYFQHKTKKIPPTFGLHTFPNISGIKLTGSSSSETSSREDTTRKDASIAHAQASCVFWGALGHLMHPREADSYNIGHTGKRVPPGPGGRSQGRAPQGISDSTRHLCFSKLIKSYSIAVCLFLQETRQRTGRLLVYHFCLRSRGLRMRHKTQVPAHQLLFCNLCPLPKQLPPVNIQAYKLAFVSDWDGV